MGDRVWNAEAQYEGRLFVMGRKQGNTVGRGRSTRRRWRAPLLVLTAMAGGALLAPAMGNAFAGGSLASALPRVSLAARGGIGSFTPASVDPRLVAQLAAQISGQFAANGQAGAPMFRFTPAGSETRPNRSVTVAVRVDGAAAQALAVRGPRLDGGAEAGTVPVRIGPAGFAPAGFSLGVARGYQSFAAGSAKPLTAGVKADQPVVRAEMPDFSGFELKGRDGTGTPSRLAPRIELDQRDKAGRAPRTYEGQSSAYQVDVGGSYRLSRNINVTAGLRYSSDKERLRALSDTTKDSQAVYVGTQFRF